MAVYLYYWETGFSVNIDELFWQYSVISGNIRNMDIDSLLPRRSEIYYIIKDHELVNFDMLHRRFMGINERTLRYDLKKLVDAGLIQKLGQTKGVYYKVKK